MLKRLDHSNIFLIIAGTYTPFALLLLPEGAVPLAAAHRLGRRHRRGAVPGLLGRRAALALHPDLRRPRAGSPCSTSSRSTAPAAPRSSSLIAVGGLLYTLGAVVYGTKRPDPSPRWFGFHEIFHVFTVAAFAVHYVAASIAVYGHATAL